MRYLLWILFFTPTVFSAGRLATLARSQPLEIIDTLASVQRKRPSLTLWVPQRDWLESVRTPGFKRVDTLDPSKLNSIPRFTSIQNSMKIALNHEEVPADNQARRWLLTPDLKRTTADALLIDDFFPLHPGEHRHLQGGLKDTTFLLPGPDLEAIQDEESLIRADQHPLFQYPLGQKDLDAATPYALDTYVLYHNSLGRQTFEFFRDLQSQREKGSQAKPLPLIEDMGFTEFVRFLQNQDLVLYYPDPHSPKTRKHGLAFLCQLLSWLEPESYQRLLETPESPLIYSIYSRMKAFLNKNSRVLKPMKSMDNILEAINQETVLANLPSGFDPLNPPFDWELPSTYDLFQVSHRLAFGFLPESFVTPEFVKASYKDYNSEILAKKERIRQEEIARRKARERRMRERRQRSRDRTTDAEEEQEFEDESKFEEPEALPSFETSISQILPLTIGKTIARRYYSLIPAAAPNPEASAYFINGLLFPAIQKALSIQPHYLRALNSKAYQPAGDIEVYVPRLVSLDDEENRKANEWFGLQFRLSQSQVEKSFQPVLNPFYLRAFEVLPWDK